METHCKTERHRPAPAPGLKGVAGPLVEVSLHGDAVGGIRVEIHDGVVIGDVLEMSTSQ